MDKKGLSAVVTTLIIILLVLVAVGIVWVVVRNVVETGTGQLDLNAKCLAVKLDAVSVEQIGFDGTEATYRIKLHRDAGGEAIGGVKISLHNDTDSSGVLDFGQSIDALDTVYSDIDTATTNATKLEYTAYFVDASGNEQACLQTNEREF
jgi:hypothetical protein